MEKTQSSVPGFLTKLWTLVDDESTDEIIRWSDSGKSFQILDGGRLAKELLPLYFKHSNLASFIRQLNMYGFHKVLSGSMMERSAFSDDMEFAHSFFLRGRPELLERIKRKVTYGRSGILEPVSFPRAASPMHTSQATRGQSSGQTSNDAAKWGVVVAADSAQRQPVRELPRLVQQITALQAKQNAMNARLTSVKQENEALWRELHTLRTKHDKQQHVVNKIVQFLISLVGQTNAPARRFLPGIKRNMTGQTFGGPAAITLNNKPSSNSNLYSGDVNSDMDVRTSSTLSQPNVAAAAIDLMSVANSLLAGDTSQGAQQTVFVEEIEDDADIADFRTGNLTDESQVWSPLSSGAGIKRRRVMTSSGEDAGDSYVYDDAYVGDPYNVDSAGVQISELDTVWPVVSNPASMSAPTLQQTSLSIAGDSSAAVSASASAVERSSAAPRISLATTPPADRIDFNSLFESIVDPHTQAQLSWPVQSPTSSSASGVDVKLRSDSGLKSPTTSNAAVIDDATVGLPVMSNQTSARDILNENLDNIQLQLDGLRAFLANEQYTTDDNMLMELFNAESDVIPRANVHEVGSTNSNQAAGLRRLSNDVVGHELVEYTDPSSLHLLEFFSEPSSGVTSFPISAITKSAGDVNAATDSERETASSSSSSNTTIAKKVAATSSKPVVTILKPPNATDALNTPEVADETPKRPFIVKTFTPTTNFTTNTSASATQSRQSITPNAKRS